MKYNNTISLQAKCVRNTDPWTGREILGLEIGKVYNVECSVIGRSWSHIYVKEFPHVYINSNCFEYYYEGQKTKLINPVVRHLIALSNSLNWHNSFCHRIFVYAAATSETVEFVAEYENWGRKCHVPIFLQPTMSLEELDKICRNPFLQGDF